MREVSSHHRSPLLDNSCFLGGDLGQGLSEHIAVIQGDRCDHTYKWLNHIGCIEPAPQTSLVDRHIARLTRKVPERKTGTDLKIAQRNLLKSGLELHSKSMDLIVRNGHSVVPHPVVVPQQMGRGIETCLVTGTAEHRRKHLGSGPLPVGSCHMDSRYLQMRISHPATEIDHPVEAKISSFDTDLTEFRDRLQP